MLNNLKLIFVLLPLFLLGCRSLTPFEQSLEECPGLSMKELLNHEKSGRIENKMVFKYGGNPFARKTKYMLDIKWEDGTRSDMLIVTKDVFDKAFRGMPIGGVRKTTTGSAGRLKSLPSTSGVTADSSIRSFTKTGRVVITSMPDHCDVYINGKFVATTPTRELQFDAGELELEIRKEGYTPWKRKVSILKDNVSTIHAELQPQK